MAKLFYLQLTLSMIPDTFGNASLLWGIVLACIPIFLFLLKRRQAGIIDWPAMQFFLKNIRKTTRWMRITEFILLMIRVSIILGIVYALARPATLSTTLSESRTMGTSGTVILLDNSFSMGWRKENGKGPRVWDLARESALRLLEHHKTGDAIWIVTIAGGAKSVRQDPFRNKAEAQMAIEELQLEGGISNILDGLDLAAELLPTTPTESRNIYVFSDLQKITWKMEEKERWAFVLDRLKVSLPPPALHLMSLREKSESTESNNAVLSLGVSRAVVGTDRSIDFLCKIAQFGKGADSSIKVALTVNDLTIESRTVGLSENQQTEIRFQHRFNSPGTYRIAVRIDGDSLEVDDHRLLSLNVVDKIPVLIIEGERDTSQPERERNLIDLALAPRAGEEITPEVLFHPRSISSNNLLDSGILEAFVSHDNTLLTGRLIVLSNVPILDSRAIEHLEQFVRNGGGLLIFLGQQVNIRSYNTQLVHGDGKGLLPARLTAWMSAENGHFISPRGFRLDHPSFEPFSDINRNDFEAIQIKNWMDCQAPFPGTTLLAELPNDGKPFILEKPFGRGRVLLIATSARLEDSDLPGQPIYVPLVHGFAYHLAQEPHTNNQLLAGENLNLLLHGQETSAADTHVSVELPDASLKAIQIDRLNHSIVPVKAPVPGFYTFYVRAKKKERAITFAVNPDTAESDLAGLDEDALEILESIFEFSIHRDGSPMDLSIDKSFQRDEHWPWIILVVLILVMAEVFLTRRLTHKKIPVPSRVRVSLFGLRISTVIILILLFADFSIQRETEIIKKPELLLILDGSRSMLLRDPHRSTEQLTDEIRALTGGSLTSEEKPTQQLRSELLSMSRNQLIKKFFHSPATPGGRSTLTETLQRNFQLIPYFLGKNPGIVLQDSNGNFEFPPADGVTTDLGKPIVDAITHRSHDSLGAVILISDGGHNSGHGPHEVLGAIKTIGVPIFTLGAGASEWPRDIGIVNVEGPQTVYKRDPLQLSLTLKVVDMPAMSVPIRVHDGKEQVEGFTVELPASHEQDIIVPVPLSFSLEKGGRIKLTVSLPQQSSETNTENNSRDLWMDVLDEKIRVLYLDGAPRWEFRYLRNALESDSNISAESLLLTRPPDLHLPAGFPRQREALFSREVVILGDVHRRAFSVEELKSLHDFVTIRGGSLVLMAGENAMPYSFAGTPLEEIIPVKLQSPPPPNSEGALIAKKGFKIHLTQSGERSPILRLDSNRELNHELWSLFPKQYWVCPHAGAKIHANVLATGENLSLETKNENEDRINALMVTQSIGAGKVFFIAVDSTWLWRFRVGEEFFSRFWGQVVRWAASDRLLPGDRNVRIGTSQARYETPDTVSIRALILDDSGSPLEGSEARADAEIIREDSENTQRLRLESIPQSGGVFRGNIQTGNASGELKAGEYTVKILTPSIDGYNQRNDRAQARMVVAEPPSREGDTLIRNEQLLDSLTTAAATGGRYLPIEQAHKLVDLLPKKEIRAKETQLVEQWDFAWILMFLLVGLLGIEWVIRDRYDLV